MAKKIKKGKRLEELMKGSMDFTMQAIRDAFRAQFPYLENGVNFFIEEIFADYAILKSYSNESPLGVDEYYKVAYQKLEGGYSFSAQDAWEVVELAYQPQTTITEGSKGKKSRFTERVFGEVTLEEAVEEKPRRVRFKKAMTAGIINKNGRRYQPPVVSAAFAELSTHLHESAGQGRAIQILGEAEHPSDKSTRRANLLETVVKWEEHSFDGVDATIIGSILETSKGRDILALMEGGIMPGVSMRGYGNSRFIKEDGRRIEEVLELHITGFDLVLEPSFTNAAELLESMSNEEDDMLEELKKLLAENPELFGKSMTEAKLNEMNEKSLEKLEESLREKLNLGEDADIGKALEENASKAAKFDAMEAQKEVDTAIEEATKELPYGATLNVQFVEALQASEPADAEQVKTFAEAKRVEYDKIAAGLKLGKMGFGDVKILGSVLESETGVPEYARASFELNESIRKTQMKPRRDLRKAETASEIFTAQLLERFDEMNRPQLIRENKMLQEAELVSDLNLPYSVSRAIIEEAFPNLIAANVFEVGILQNSPGRLYYETYAGESGYAPSITGESVTAAHDAWVNLAHRGRLTPGTVVVTNAGATVTYVEGTHYVIDYAGGRIKALSTGTITDGQSLLADYDYTAVRKGEMAAIERAKLTLAYKTVEAAADRLAQQISREAVVFSRAQLGYDATARTLASLSKQLRRKVDEGMLYMAWSAVKSVASNSGGTWTAATDSLDDLAEKIGVAKVKVADRYYAPTGLLMSVANADVLSNWKDGFKRDGFPSAVLNAAGFAGSVKGLPIFASTEFPDSEIVVINRQLVQHMVFNPMVFKGPFPTYDSSGNLIAADQYYIEEFNVTESLVPEKGAYVVIA